MGESPADHLDAMRRSQLFDDLTEEELARVAEICVPRSFADGDTVIREDEQGKDLFIVANGRASVELASPVSGGSPQRLGGLETGELFGELSIVDGSLRSATVRSQGPLSVLVIDNQDLLGLMEGDTQIGFKIMRNVARVLSRRLRGTSMRLRNALLELTF